ncbi:Ger(x)C family spore germination C-terminal domain-containing protein [Sulfobacillus harzensis]|nr:Ger(x)C family spore germination C-terminal domain-containing protein [Sulfobacillus harzensis]
MIAGALLGVLMVLLSGCWDELSMANRASALVLSVQPAPNQRLKWTFYFPNPAVTINSLNNLSAGQQFYEASATAASLGRAYQKVQIQLARDLYMGQLEDVVISRRLPADTLSEVINAYNREGILPKTVYILARSAALNTGLPVTVQDPVPTVYLTKYFDCRACQPVELAQPAWKVWDKLRTPGVSPVIPYESKTTRISELLVYPVNGQPRLLSHRLTVGWAYLTNHVIKESLSYSTPEGQVTVNNITSHARVKLTLRRGMLQAFVTIHANGDLTQWPPSTAVTPKDIRVVESKAARQLVASCLDTVQFADRTHTDPFGWGRDYLFRHPGSSLEFSKHGGMIWPINAHVTVTMHIPTVGVSS